MSDTESEPAAAAPAAGSPPVPPIVQFTSLRVALQDALEATPHLVRDRATIALAFRYADIIDDAQDRLAEADEDDQARNFARMVAVVDKIGGRLQATLDRMGMAPGARAATRDGDPQGGTGGADAGADHLARLRAAAGSPPGVDPAALVDPAVTEVDAAD